MCTLIAQKYECLAYRGAPVWKVSVALVFCAPGHQEVVVVVVVVVVTAAAAAAVAELTLRPLAHISLPGQGCLCVSMIRNRRETLWRH